MVENTTPAQTPRYFWAVGIASLLWNSLGAVDYFMTKTHNQVWLEGFTAEQIAWLDNYPIWANVAWALGVWGALAGSVLLLMRKSWSVEAFAISLAGLAAATVYQFGMGDMPESLNTAGGMVFSAFLWAVAIGLFVYARKMRATGVLR
jgi:hypothetical protein